MRGDVVLVRTFGGKAVKRRVWDVGHSVVYVTNDEQFAKLTAGKSAVEPIGFPKEDVFKVTDNESSADTVDWARLAPWNG